MSVVEDTNAVFTFSRAGAQYNIKFTDLTNQILSGANGGVGVFVNRDTGTGTNLVLAGTLVLTNYGPNPNFQIQGSNGATWTFISVGDTNAHSKVLTYKDAVGERLSFLNDGTISGNGSGLVKLPINSLVTPENVSFAYVPTQVGARAFTNTMILGNGGTLLNTNPPFPLTGLPGQNADETNGIQAGQFNTVVGWNAGVKLTTGDQNVFVGQEAGFWNDIGAQNTFLGMQAGLSNTYGIHNTYLGGGAGKATTTNIHNVFIGCDCALIATNSNYSVLIGSSAGGISLGDECVFVGYTAGSTAAGIRNTSIGALSGQGLTGNRNVVMGYQAAPSLNGDDNIAIGYHAAFASTGTTGMIAIGTSALQSMKVLPDPPNYSIGIGYEALKQVTNSTLDTAVGYRALNGAAYTSQNTAIGAQSLLSFVKGVNNTAIGTLALANQTVADNNTAVGENAGNQNGTAKDMTAIGHNSLFHCNAWDNTGVGDSAGATITTGVQNTFLGSQSDATVNSVANSTAIGYLTTVTNSNQVVIGNTSVTETILRGTARVGGALTASTTIAATNGFISMVANKSAVTTISVGSSPFSYTNTSGVNGNVIIDGSVAFSATWLDTTVQTSLAGGITIPLQNGEWTTVTYTVAPGMYFKKL